MPETIHLDALLPVLREASLQVAIVVDEYGGTSGVVTLEDLIEEIVGEVADEHDRIAPGVLQAASGDWYFPGLMRPDEINTQILELHIPDDAAYETVAGYVLFRLGRIAAVGDLVEVEGGQLEVTQIDGRRIDRVRFSPDPEARRAAQEAAAERDRKLAEEREEHARLNAERMQRVRPEASNGSLSKESLNGDGGRP